MLLIKQRPYNSQSRNTFPVSMEGCVLNLPLWQEDMQGSTLLSYDKYLHTPTVTGATWGYQGRTFGPVLDDYIACGDSTVFDITTAITLEAVFKVTGVTGDQFIVGRDNGGAGRNYWMVLNDANLRMVVVIGGVQKYVSFTASANIWYHAIGTYDGTNVNLTVNGVAQTPTAATGTIDNGDVPLTIGRRTSDRYLGGIIGELRIYNRSLPSAECMGNSQATKSWRYQ